MAIKIKKVGLIGVGTMGTQIAIQASAYGYDMNVYDQDPEIFQKTFGRLLNFIKISEKEPTIPVKEWEKYAQNVKQYKDLSEALRDKDLVIEACPENLELKRKILAQIDSFAPERAILSTNSSSIPISKIEGATKGLKSA